MCRTHAWTKLCGTFIECYWADRNCPQNHYDISSNFLLNVTLDFWCLMPDSFLHKIKYIVNVIRCLITCALTQFLLLLVNLCVLQCSPSYIGTTFWTPSMFFFVVFFFPPLAVNGQWGFVCCHVDVSYIYVDICIIFCCLLYVRCLSVVIKHRPYSSVFSMSFPVSLNGPNFSRSRLWPNGLA